MPTTLYVAVVRTRIVRVDPFGASLLATLVLVPVEIWLFAWAFRRIADEIGRGAGLEMLFVALFASGVVAATPALSVALGASGFNILVSWGAIEGLEVQTGEPPPPPVSARTFRDGILPAGLDDALQADGRRRFRPADAEDEARILEDHAASVDTFRGDPL